jgi:hypothetical protein
MMFYYAEFVGNRHAADRLRKQRKKVTTVSGRVAREEGILGDVAAAKRDNSQGIFMEIARRVAAKHGPACDFGNAKWDARLIDQSHDQVLFHIFCKRHRFDRTYYVPLAEFRSVAQEVAKELAAEEDR